MYKKNVENITSDPTSASDLTGGTYEKINTGVISPATTSAISDISFDSTYPHLMFPTAVGSPNPSGDTCYANTNFNCVLAGGNFSYGLSDGLFAFYADSAVGFAGSSYGVCAIE